MRFAQSNISVLQEYATIDFSIAVLKIILVSCVHKYYMIDIKIMPGLHFSVKNENCVRVRV